MINRKTVLLIILLTLLIACAVAQAKSEFQILDGKSHWQYILRKPYDSDAPAPLVVVLHGMGGDARSMAVQWASQPGMDKMYVVAPQATGKSRVGKSVSTWQSSLDDDFIMRLVGYMMKTYRIDAKRVAIVGYSAGGYHAARLAQKNPDVFGWCVVSAAAASAAKDTPKNLKWFLLSGGADGSFNAKRAQALADELTQAGVSVQMEVVPGADHASIYAKNAPATHWLVKELLSIDQTAK